MRIHPIVPTHLDFDHAGGLDDLPHTRLLNPQRLPALAATQGADVTVFRARVPNDFERLAGRAMGAL